VIGVTDPRLAALAEAYAEKAEPLPEGRSGSVTREDLEATMHRIKTGLPMAPMNGWRW
jgi:hypothetical protein